MRRATTIVAMGLGAALLGLPASALAGEPNIDPYNYDPQFWVNAPIGPLTQAMPQARADSCFYQKPVYNKAGKLVGHRTVNGCEH